jgi:hypothetical protein
MKKTLKKIKTLIKKAEQPPRLYLATSQILNSSGKVWSGIITTHHKILARFNNHQVIRSLEAKAYLILRTIYWLIEQKQRKALLFTDNSNILNRFLKLSQRPLEKPYSVEPEFRLTQRGKMPWPTYLWLARKLIAERRLNITLNYLSPSKNPATLITKSLKVCAKCHRLKALAPNKRNCSLCWKSSRKKQYESWLAWRQTLKNYD